MSDSGKSGSAAALTAALSMLGLSLGVSGPAEAQYFPGAAGAQPSGPPVTPHDKPGTQGVLIGLNQPGAQQIKSEQWKSEQLKSEQLKSQQLKSQQLKVQSNQVKLAPH
jgi:hypothetical protein